ncbi:MAG: hypothetical protein R2708_24250 [Vicinamibacterales bacterium]
MTTKAFAVPAALAAALSVGLQAARSTPAAPGHQALPAGAAEVVVSTQSAQEDVGLTVYNGGLALVRDVRRVSLPAGEVHLRFEDIAATVNPATVHLRSTSQPGRLPVLEQNYEYDLLDPQKLLSKYVGRDVTLVRTTIEGGSSKTTEVTARLLALNNGPVWRIGDEIVTGIGVDHLRFPALPESLYSRPTLVWALDNQGAAAHRVEAAYLAGNIGWNADYVLTLDAAGAAADLDGWVTMKNQSGTSFHNARLQLVAGDLHRAPAAAKEGFVGAAVRVAEARDEMAEQAFAEYHLYTLGRRTTIANAETKQLALLHGTGVPVARRYVVNGQAWAYRNRQNPGTPLKDSVQVFYDFRNDAASNLGRPMPAGVVRVYQTDPGGQVQYVGEDRIDHTPKDERLTVQIGTAFDVVCERRQTDFQNLGGSTYELAYEITLRNRKDVPVSVEVNEPIGGDWAITTSTHRWTKTEAWAAQFVVPVAAGGTSTLRYRVRVKW